MKSFLHGKKTLPVESLRAPTGAPGGLARAAAGSRGQAAAVEPEAGPQVQVVKEGDKVVKLVVTCTCGERLEIDCHYQPGA